MKRHFAATREIVAPAVERVLDSGWYILGNEGESFEKEFAAYCGAEICVGVGNGTDALELALRSVGVTQALEWRPSANAGFYTSTTLLAIGASPVFVDVDRTTHLMDPKCLREVLAQGVEAVVVTHLYGLLCDMDEIGALSSQYGTPVIEDCAQAHGAVGEEKELAASETRLLSVSTRPKTLARSVMPGWWLQVNRPSLQRYGCCANMAGILNITSR